MPYTPVSDALRKAASYGAKDMWSPSGNYNIQNKPADPLKKPDDSGYKPPVIGGPTTPVDKPPPLKPVITPPPTVTKPKGLFGGTGDGSRNPWNKPGWDQKTDYQKIQTIGQGNKTDAQVAQQKAASKNKALYKQSLDDKHNAGEEVVKGAKYNPAVQAKMSAALGVKRPAPAKPKPLPAVGKQTSSQKSTSAKLGIKPSSGGKIGLPNLPAAKKKSSGGGRK